MTSECFFFYENKSVLFSKFWWVPVCYFRKHFWKRSWDELRERTRSWTRCWIWWRRTSITCRIRWWVWLVGHPKRSPYRYHERGRRRTEMKPKQAMEEEIVATMWRAALVKKIHHPRSNVNFPRPRSQSSTCRPIHLILHLWWVPKISITPSGWFNQVDPTLIVAKIHTIVHWIGVFDNT